MIPIKKINVVVTNFGDEDYHFGQNYKFENVSQMITFITDVLEYAQGDVKIEIFKSDINKDV